MKQDGSLIISERDNKTKILYFIISLLVTSNLLLGGFFVYERYFRVQKFVNLYPYIDLSRNFIPQEHFIVNIQPLREKLQELVKREDLDISLYFEYLNTGANISINQENRILPASLVKLPLAIAVMKKIESGEWALDSELVLLEEDRDLNYGGLFKEPIGTRITIERLVRAMLHDSDNTAFHILARNLDLSYFEELVKDTGLDELFDVNGLITAKEYSRLFRTLYTSSFLKRENSQKLLQILSEAEFKDWLSAPIPQNIIFSHKFGIQEDTHTYLDSGIVYVPNRPYLITVLIRGNGRENESRKISEIMHEINNSAYTYVKTQ